MLALWNYLTLSLKTRLDDEKGATAVEYTLLLVLIAVVLAVTISAVGQQLLDVWVAIQDALTEAL
jgi:Flp pilus assembly pilin Flp